MVVEPVLFVLKLVLYLLPPYLANSCAMLMGGKTPLDFNMRFLDNKPILGQGKTFKGTFFGIFAGVFVAAILNAVFPGITALLSNEYVMLGVLLAVGAVLGDAVASFLKRRRNVPRGKEVVLLDQLDFVVGAMVLGSLIYIPSWEEVVTILIVTLIAHKLSNFIAYHIKLKRVPW